MSGKNTGTGTIITNFHGALLCKLPGVGVGRACGQMVRCRRTHFPTTQKRRTKLILRCTLKQLREYIQAKRDTNPRRVAGLEIRAHLEAWLAISYVAAVYTPCFPYRLKI